jgi:poly(A) polymerase
LKFKNIFTHSSLLQASTIIKTLKDNGFKAYFVGGCLRDLYLGVTPKDIDVTTDAKPTEIKKLFKRAYIIGKRFQLVHVYVKNHLLEVATFRQLGEENIENENFNHNIFGTVEEDAFRRDFTLNALYYDPTTDEFLDFCKGVDDLDSKIIKSIGDPEIRFQEDPLRIIRAIRLSAKLNFSISEDDTNAILKFNHLLTQIPSARIFEEFIKFSKTTNLFLILKMLEDFNIKNILCKNINSTDDEIIKIFTENTNNRIKDNKPLNPAFMFAVLLWQEKIISSSKSLTSFSSSLGSLNIPKKITAVMHVIWANQKRFSFTKGKRPFKLLRQPLFRASLDFYELRVKSGLLDNNNLKWWLTFVEENTDNK